MAAAAGLVLANLAGASAAQAQYAPYPPPPPPPPPGYYPADGRYDPAAQPYLPYREPPAPDRVFTGVRVEARLAYDRLLVDPVDEDAAFAPRSRSGLGYGGEIGFDVAAGRLVLGAYAGAAGSTIRECEARAAAMLCIRPGRSFSAGGRVGVAVGRTTLLYAKGGYANGRIRVDGIVPASPIDNVTIRRDLDGFEVGGGVEKVFSGRAYGKVEYVYTRLSDFRPDADPDDRVDFDRHQVQAGVGVRF